MGLIAALAGIGVLAIVTFVFVVKNLYYVCEPNEVLVFSDF